MGRKPYFSDRGLGAVEPPKSRMMTGISVKNAVIIHCLPKRKI